MQAALPPVQDPIQERSPAHDMRTWLVAVPLASIVIYAFLPALGNGFLVWDDDQNFLANPYFRGLGPAQLRWAWTTFWVGAYQPLAWMLFGAEYVFCRLDPRGYHVTSLFLHAVNALVLYQLTVAMLFRCRAESTWTYSLSAGLATALFMTHPLRVEAVAWASCQPYLPCALCSMLSVLAYLRAFPVGSSPRWSWLAGSFLLFIAAMLFKAVAVSLPAVLLILDVYPLKRIPEEPRRWLRAPARRALWEKVPFVLVSVLFMALAIAAKPQSHTANQQDGPSAGVARACYAIWFYIQKTVLPLGLSAFYPAPRELNWLDPRFRLHILAVAATTAALFYLRRFWPGLLAAWLSYLVILAPNAGIVRISDQIAADRYSYVSMMGLVVMTAAGFCEIWRMTAEWRAGSFGFIAMSLGALLGLTVATRQQCRTWHDSEAIWVQALNHEGNPPAMVCYNLGSLLYDQGKYQAAQNYFAEALRIDPRFDRAHNNLGNVLYLQGERETAEAHFAEALRLNPGYADAHYNLGLALQAKGKDEAAEAHYAEVVRLRPGFARAHKNWGDILFNRRKYEAASPHFSEALRFNPGDVDAHNRLGTILSREGRYAEAEAHFAAATRLEPGDPHGYNASAMLMATCPDAKFRDGKRAVELATHACELTQWKNPVILDTLAAAQAEAGDFDAAARSQKRVLELLPGQQRTDDYRSRLELYQGKKPYRQTSSPKPRPD